MKRVIINAICAFILMLVQANFDAAFGIQALAQFGIIAAVLTGMTSMSMRASSISMLLLALLCDIFSSGPVGIYAIAFMLVFGLSRAILFRFHSERIIAVMIACAVMSALFEFLLALLYCAYYWDSAFLTVFVHVFWKDLILTAIFAPVVMWLCNILETALIRHKKNSLT